MPLYICTEILYKGDVAKHVPACMLSNTVWAEADKRAGSVCFSRTRKVRMRQAEPVLWSDIFHTSAEHTDRDVLHPQISVKYACSSILEASHEFSDCLFIFFLIQFNCFRFDDKFNTSFHLFTLTGKTLISFGKI